MGEFCCEAYLSAATYYLSSILWVLGTNCGATEDACVIAVYRGGSSRDPETKSRV